MIAFNEFNWNNYFKRNFIIVIISALIGPFSHIAWDSFTHEDGFAVETITYLSNGVSVAGKDFPIFKLLQHGSSVLGMLVIGWTIFSLPKYQLNNVPTESGRYWTIVVTVSLVILRANFGLGLNLKIFGHLVVTLISSTLIGLILASVYINLPKSNKEVI